MLNTDTSIYKRLYVTNPNPTFTPPPQKKERPAFIRATLNKIKSIDVARSELFYTLQPINPITLTPIYRKRRMNEHRAKAIRVLAQACIFHMNIATGMIQATVTTLSNECGLTSKSKIGYESISRCCRAILHLEQYGILRCEKVWDRTLNMWIPKIIWVTELFFAMIKLETGKYEAAQRQQLAWINQGIMKAGEEPISITEARRRAKELHIKRAFEHRQRQHHIKKQHKKAIKLMALKEVEARSQILTELVARYSKIELQEMGYEQLKKQVDIIYYQFRKLSQSPPN